MSILNNRKAYTLIELLIVVIIFGLIIVGTLKIYTYLTRNNAAIKTSLQVQQDLLLACRFLEKDIHMTGYALPGNGIVSDLDSAGRNKIHFFSNKNHLSTKLTYDVFTNDIIIKVDEAKGADSTMWICLHDDDKLVYYPIQHIRFSDTDPDTITLDTLLNNNWEADDTEIHFTEHILYQVENTVNGNALVRNKGEGEFVPGNSISQLDLTLTDESNNVETTPYNDARTITAIIGAPCSDAHGDRVITEMISVNIRNYK